MSSFSHQPISKPVGIFYNLCGNLVQNVAIGLMSYIMFSFPVSALFEMSEGEQNQFDKETEKFPFRKAIKRLVCLILMAWNIKKCL